MRKLTVYSEFFPEKVRDYVSGNIFRLVRTVEKCGTIWYLLENDVWVRQDQEGKYYTDWTVEEAWGRVDEAVENEDGTVGAKTIGFVILTISRRSGRIY